MKSALAWMAISLILGSPAFAQYSDSIFYGNQKVVLSNPYGWGYIAGTNEYGDRAKFQRFEAFETPYLVAARVFFGLKRIVNSSDTLTITVRDAGVDGPGGILSSVRLTTNLLDTTGRGNLVTFPHPAQFKGEVFTADSLFIGVEWAEAIDDTFAIFADSNGYGDKARRVWELINYNSVWTMWPWLTSPDPSFEWNVDSDLWIKAYLSNSPTGVHSGDEILPVAYSLDQNYPNPFNPGTTIRYRLPQQEFVTLMIHNALGEMVTELVREVQDAGSHEVRFDGSGLPSGVYWYSFRAGTFLQAKKLLLLR